MSSTSTSQFKGGDQVQFIAGDHRGVTGRVIQSFQGHITVMQPNNVTVMDVAEHAVKVSDPTPTAAG